MIKLVVFDFDGVFTDGTIFYNSIGEVLKSYNVRDGMGIKLLRDKAFKTGLISSHLSDATKHIAMHLNFDLTSVGSLRSKYEILNNWRIEYQLSWDEIAYLGDDLVDLQCMSAVGFSACPADAVCEIKSITKYVCEASGGKGAVREFCEHLLNTF